MRFKLVTALTMFFIVTAAHPAQAKSNWVYPSSNHKIIKTFSPPTKRWAAGHRGIDFPALAGQKVFASGAGVITFAGLVANKEVVVITHGSVRTTYEPVKAAVAVGDVVNTGQVIGRIVASDSHCSANEVVTCLHWGAIKNERYINPMLLLTQKIKLLPNR